MSARTRLRVGHCSPDAPNLDVRVDGAPTFENVTFGGVREYVPLDPGPHEIRVVPAAGGDPIAGVDVDLATGTSYTVLATGVVEAVEPTVFEDDPAVPSPDDARVRFVHASPDAPSVTVAVRGGPVLFADVGFRSGTGYETVAAGTYDLDVRFRPGTDPALPVETVALDGGAVYTLVAIGRTVDGPLSTVVVEDCPVSLATDD
jgi:hypothetical protein